MARDRLTVLRAILDAGAVPAFVPLDAAAARRVVFACAEAGAPVIEVTNRAAGTVALFRDLVAWAAQAHPEVVLGMRTVIEAPTAALFIDAGAEFW